MKVPKRFLLMAALAVVGVLGPQAIPAHAATHVGGGVFLGHATVTPGLWSPVGPACGTNTCPGGTGSWNLTGSGVGVSVSTDPSVAGPVFDLTTSSGSLHAGVAGLGAWCGLSSGSGTVHWSFTTPVVTVVPGHHGSATVHWLTSAASVIVVTSIGNGGVPSDPSLVVAVVDAVPPTPAGPGGSCLAGTAVSFTVVGAAAIVHLGV